MSDCPEGICVMWSPTISSQRLQHQAKNRRKFTPLLTNQPFYNALCKRSLHESASAPKAKTTRTRKRQGRPLSGNPKRGFNQEGQGRTWRNFPSRQVHLGVATDNVQIQFRQLKQPCSSCSSKKICSSTFWGSSRATVLRGWSWRIATLGSITNYWKGSALKNTP